MIDIKPAPGEWRVSSLEGMVRIPFLTITKDHLKEALRQFIEDQREDQRANGIPCTGEVKPAERVAEAGAPLVWNLLCEQAGEEPADSVNNQPNQD